MASTDSGRSRTEVAFPRSPDPIRAEPISAPNGGGGVDLAAIWSALRSGKWIILASVALATTAAVTYSMMVTPSYEATSVVAIRAQGSAVPGSEFVVAQIPEVRSEVNMLEKSTELARRVYGSLEESAAGLGTTEFFPLLQPEAALERPAWEELSFRMTFWSSGIDQINISAFSSAPEEASQLANLYAIEYAEQSRERTRASLVAARQYLDEQLAQSEEILNEAQREWESFSRRNDIVASGAGGERIVADYVTLTSRRDQVRFEIRRLTDTNAQLSVRAGDMQTSTTGDTSIRDQVRADYLTEQIRQLTAVIEAWYANDPSLRGNESREEQLLEPYNKRDNFEQELEVVRRRILNRTTNTGATGAEATARATEIRNQIAANDLQIAQYRTEDADLSSRIAGLESQLGRIPGQIFEVEELERRRNRERTYVDGLREKLRDISIAEQSELGFVHVLGEATTPNEPVSPDLQGNLIMALLLGTVFGAGLAFLRSAVTNQLQSPDEVEHLGYRLLGVVPSMQREIQATFKGKREIEINGKVRSAALVTLHSPWSPAAEHYRLVRTNLQAIAREKGVKLILMTSPEPADGKTVSAVNMAISMAQNGSRTLLIDCDLRKATIARTLGVDRSPGVGEILTDEAVPDDFAAYQTDIEDLFCIPAGVVTSPPPELLGSRTMEKLLAAAKEEFDVVIVDSPPVLAVTDAVVLAPMCDAAVIVVAANKTSPRGVRTTITTLHNLGVDIAGVVFNQFNQSRSAAGYYEYQYGYAYAEEAES